MAWKAGGRMAETEEAATMRAKAQQNIGARPAGKKGRLFTRAEVYAFLDQAKRAEAISDPLQRCLAYPDPPGSHWSPAAVGAYCKYRLQKLMPFSEMESLIQNGKSAELDRRLADALQAQMTRPESRGLLDRTYEIDFNGSFDIRPTLDAWKRDSPNSAFAYAASGYAYQKMAAAARGSGYIRDTPQSDLLSMSRLMKEADTDLRHAIALDPRIMPAYDAMISVGGLEYGHAYAMYAAKKGLAIEPGSYALYSSLMWLNQPNWYGSLEEMNRLATAAQMHAKDAPLLMLLTSEAHAKALNTDDCDCHTVEDLAAYPAAFDQIATSRELLNAGDAASSSHQHELAAVYLSEALRFNADLNDERLRRVTELVDFDQAQWAAAEATRLLHMEPKNSNYLKARGWAYESAEDYKHAAQDYRAAYALNPQDGWPLMELGNIYVYSTHEWDKGWEIDNEIIHAYPDNAYGWILRAEIQKDQPRVGLKDTVDYFAAHFGNDPVLQKRLTAMRAELALQSGVGKSAH